MDHSHDEDAADAAAGLHMVEDLDGDELEALELAAAAAEAEALDDGAGDEPEPPRLEISTGLLTPGQHATVAAWIERLRLDSPLPGLEPKGGMVRILGIDDRPPVSISDVVAAAVYDLCRRRMPKPRDFARYVVDARAASRDQRPDRGQHRPITVMLRAELAEAVEPYPAQVVAWLRETRAAAYEAADLAHPAEDAADYRAQFVELELIRLGIREAFTRHGVPRKIPLGAIARMGLDHWRHKSVDEAITDALAYAGEVKLQLHRLRRDHHRRTDGPPRK